MPYSETGLEDVVITYVQVPDFTGRQVKEALSWGLLKKIKIEVKGDPATEIITSQSRTTPKALKAGDYGETLTVTTGGGAAKSNTGLWIGAALLALLLLKK